MSDAIKRINAACIDGRAQTPRYIQQQLLRLHDILVENAKHIRDAIRSDSHHTASEAEVEYYLALQSVKDQYLQLNVERAIKEEYHLANMIDSPSRVAAAGVVYILPADHTRLYSIIAPVAAAIAAGNCVVLEVSKAQVIILIHGD
jgi:acyl-CoA reductase-like NAD-dependent aldehyde dehydrogenase